MFWVTPVSASGSDTSPASRPSDVVGAGAAGGGFGTILATVADGLPESSPWKSLLTVSAPILAVALSATGLFIKGLYVDPYAARRRRRAEEAELDRLLKNAKDKRDSVCADPGASEVHKAELRRRVEEVELLIVQRYRERTVQVVQAPG